jgi:hypothetical protein
VAYTRPCPHADRGLLSVDFYRGVVHPLFSVRDCIELWTPHGRSPSTRHSSIVFGSRKAECRASIVLPLPRTSNDLRNPCPRKGPAAHSLLPGRTLSRPLVQEWTNERCALPLEFDLGLGVEMVGYRWHHLGDALRDASLISLVAPLALLSPRAVLASLPPFARSYSPPAPMRGTGRSDGVMRSRNGFHLR